MIGTYQHTIDSKGRLYIPARMRDELGQSVYITFSVDKHLFLLCKVSFEELNRNVSAADEREYRYIHTQLANAEKCDIDKRGRITIPQVLANLAGLKKNVTIVGAGNTCEIWDSDRWNELVKMESSETVIRAVINELGM